VPLLKGYRIIYGPLVGSMEQAEVPLSVDEPEPDKPHTIACAPTLRSLRTSASACACQRSVLISSPGRSCWRELR
jgi:hypothetical protein